MWSQAKEAKEYQVMRRGKEGFFPGALRGSGGPQTPWF